MVSGAIGARSNGSMLKGHQAVSQAKHEPLVHAKAPRWVVRCSRPALRQDPSLCWLASRNPLLANSLRTLCRAPGSCTRSVQVCSAGRRLTTSTARKGASHHGTPRSNCAERGACRPRGAPGAQHSARARTVSRVGSLRGRKTTHQDQPRRSSKPMALCGRIRYDRCPHGWRSTWLARSSSL